METRTVFTVDAPKPLGPYSQAMVAGGFVFVAGQLGIDPASGQLAEGVQGQVRQALNNVSAILTAAGSSIDKVVRTSVFLKDLNDFQAMNAVYQEFFGTSRPARTTVGVSLPGKNLVEIDVVATE